MSKIVVSYRRSDSQAIAGRIVDRLIAEFGEPSVFMDVDNIPFGIDFRQHIQSVLAQAQVLIAVVGPDWLGAGADGGSRIQEEDDPVRVEIETALRQEIVVIPVLVGGASMPKAAALPESLRNFAFLNAAPVDVGRDFRPHVDRLVQSIDEVLARKSGGTARAVPKSTTGQAAAPARTNARLLLAGIAVVLLLAGGAAAWQLKLRDTPSTTPTSAGTAQPADDVQWSQLKDTKDIGLLRGFIAQNPDSKHRAEAEQQISALTMQTALSAALTSGDKGVSPAGNDDDDWTKAKSAGTFDAYQAYLKSHPLGEHVDEARRAAAEVRPIANALKEEPPIGALLPGDTKIVDDHDPMCKRGEVKVVTGGNYVTAKVLRQRKCVPRDQFP
jgi:hypothetical protein